MSGRVRSWPALGQGWVVMRGQKVAGDAYAVCVAALVGGGVLVGVPAHRALELE